MNQKRFDFIITTILIVIVILRVFSIKDNDKKVSLFNSNEKIVIHGIVDSDPQIKDFNKIITVRSTRINNIEHDSRIKVTLDRFQDTKYGEKISLLGKLITPRNFYSKDGRSFDYVNFLIKDGIEFELKKPTLLKIEESAENTLLSNLYNFKKSFTNNLKKVLGEPHAALAGGLVVGEKNELGKELLDDFRKSGLIHIVVLSGYNITIVAECIRRIFSFLPKWPSIFLGILSIICFGFMVGGGATVVRSCVMASIAIIGRGLGKDYNVSKALFLAAILMVIQNPYILFYDPSFHLSFLATLGLIVLSPNIEKILSFLTEKFQVRSLVSSTIATQIFVSPYLLYTMGQISVVGIFVNILVLPFVPITMLLVALCGLTGFINNQMSIFFGWFAYLLLSYELYLVKVFARFTYSVVNVPKFSIYIVYSAYLCYLVAFTKFSSILDQFKFKKKSPI